MITARKTARQRMLELYNAGMTKENARAQMRTESYSKSLLSTMYNHNWPGDEPIAAMPVPKPKPRTAKRGKPAGSGASKSSVVGHKNSAQTASGAAVEDKAGAAFAHVEGERVPEQQAAAPLSEAIQTSASVAHDEAERLFEQQFAAFLDEADQEALDQEARPPPASDKADPLMPGRAPPLLLSLRSDIDKDDAERERKIWDTYFPDTESGSEAERNKIFDTFFDHESDASSNNSNDEFLQISEESEDENSNLCRRQIDDVLAMEAEAYERECRTREAELPGVLHDSWGGCDTVPDLGTDASTHEDEDLNHWAAI